MKSKSPLAFIDFLFILLLSFISMYILALILINPIAKKSDVEYKAEYLIIVEWDEESRDDVDTWIKDPHSNILSFRNMSIPGIHLDRDDVGAVNDVIRMPNGETKTIKINRELTTFRSWISGEYIINVHMYNMRDNVEREVRVTFMRLNPYKLLFEEKVILKTHHEEITVARVTLDEKGRMTEINKLPIKMVDPSVFNQHIDRQLRGPRLEGSAPGNR